jgi:hypothetical protein
MPTHGDSRNGTRTPEYMAWQSMNNRCRNPAHPNFKYYGKRGITVCNRWSNNYENFLADMGRRPTPGHSLDRINNDRGYEPLNCRWATRTQQMRNRQPRKLTIVMVTEIRQLYHAKTGYSQYKLAKKFGVSQRHICRIVNYTEWQDP